MTTTIGIVTETHPGERRVAVVPATVPSLAKAGLEVVIEAGAGLSAGYPDSEYIEKGARVESNRSTLLTSSDVLLQVRTLGASPKAGRGDLDHLHPSQVVIGLSEPLTAHEEIQALADCGVSLLAMDLMPRITRAQSMDCLSSMASVAGYKAVLLAAEALPKMFPMMMTAAGTIKPARVFVIGAGVAGLQAIATAKRLGAVVEAYDLRPAVKEQVESLGAKFVELELEAGESEGAGGYAKEMDDEFYRRQREMMTRVVADSDVVITTAAIPGKQAPILVTEPMVRGMATGSVIVDLAAERGGNCEVTRAGERVDVDGIAILGPKNLPSSVPYHASQMYAKNITTFLLHLTNEGRVQIDASEEITAGTLVCRGGQVVHAGVREAMGLPDNQVERTNDATKES